MRRKITLCAAGFVAASISFLPGCSSVPAWEAPSAPLHDDNAQALMKAGNFTGAAEEYLRLGQQLDPTQSYPYRIYAAEAYLEGKQPDRAESVLSTTHIPERDKRFSSWQQLLNGRIAMAHKNFAGARAILAPINDRALPLSLQTQVLRNRGYMYDKLGEDLNALENYSELDLLLTDPKAQMQVRHAAWEAARRTISKGANTSSMADNSSVGGWLALAQTVQSQQQNRIALDSALRDWQQRYPGHPGQSLLSDISAVPLKPDPSKQNAGDRVALLLPLTGQFANAGAAIRDGVIAAWYEDNDVTQTNKPKISVYDVSAKTVVAEYKRAFAEGANAVIGPLDKPAVAALIGANVVNMKTIVLNQTDLANADPALRRELQDVYEFSLAPEDEAEQVAERAWFDGHAKAYMLSPTSPWGERIRSAFKRHFEALGGTVVGARQYRGTENEGATKEPGEETVNAPERPSLDTGSTDNPAAVGADFVFLGAFPAPGRQLARDLMSHGTTLPIYATSHIYSGKPNSTDRDLSGVAFCDMPWVVDANHQNSRLALTIKQTWPKVAETYGRLFALGIDAYHLLPYLSELRGQPTGRFEGETGTLSVSANGRIRRNLTCVQYTDGRLVAIESQPPR